MARKLLTVEDFRSSARDGAAPECMVVRASTEVPEMVGESRRVRFVFSDGTVDRAGDTVDPNGWQLDNFNKNPIALFGHDSSNIDAVIGKAVNVGKVGNKLVGEIDFAGADVNPKADMAYRMVAAGLLSAVSVGFLPLEFAWSSDKNRPYGIDFQKQELMEISLVPVPCNANALIEARGLGIDTGPLAEWAERVLEGSGKIPVPRIFLEQTFKAAKTPKVIQQKYLSPETRAATDWRVGAARDLLLDESDAWDGAAAAARIFAAAGFDGDAPDSAKARCAFLVYDAANPALKGSYKLPFADIIDGEFRAVSGGLRAAASRLPQTDAPQAALDEARSVLDGYGKSGDPVLRAGRRISAANEAMLKQAMDHHEQATACIKSVLDDAADPASDDDPAAIHDPVQLTQLLLTAHMARRRALPPYDPDGDGDNDAEEALGLVTSAALLLDEAIESLSGTPEDDDDAGGAADTVQAEAPKDPVVAARLRRARALEIANSI